MRRLLLLPLVLLALGACTDRPPPLRVGTNVWTGYEPLYLARSLGYFGEPDVRLVEYSSASQVIRAFRNGAIEAAALTLDEALLLAQDGVPACIVSILDVSSGGDAILARAPLKRLVDLRGMRVGVETAALGAFVLARALEAAHLPPAAVKVVPLAAAEHEQALIEGRVDAVVTFDPARTHLVARGARTLFDSREMPGQIVDLLVLRCAYGDAHPQPVRRLIRGWFLALDYLEREPDRAAEAMAPRMGITKDEFLVALRNLRLPGVNENRLLLDDSAPRLLRDADNIMHFMLTHQLLNRPVDVRTLLDARFLPPDGR